MLTSTYQPAVATFATGTPVSNTMSEMWVMQHYLRPDVLQATGAESVTAWGQQFTKSETTLKPISGHLGFQGRLRFGELLAPGGHGLRAGGLQHVRAQVMLHDPHLRHRIGHRGAGGKGRHGWLIRRGQH